MGRLFVVNLEGKMYSCKHCRTHLALTTDVVSKIAVRLACDGCEHTCLSHLQACLTSQACDVFSRWTQMRMCVQSFQSRHGKAYLFNKVVNVTVGEADDRMMMTGLHTVADIFCVGCGSVIGWKYETAHEKSQKYKEGKCVLERYKILGPDGSNYWVTHDAHIGGSDADEA